MNAKTSGKEREKPFCYNWDHTMCSVDAFFRAMMEFIAVAVVIGGASWLLGYADLPCLERALIGAVVGGFPTAFCAGWALLIGHYGRIITSENCHETLYGNRCMFAVFSGTGALIGAFSTFTPPP